MSNFLQIPHFSRNLWLADFLRSHPLKYRLEYYSHKTKQPWITFDLHQRSAGCDIADDTGNRFDRCVHEFRVWGRSGNTEWLQFIDDQGRFHPMFETLFSEEFGFSPNAPEGFLSLWGRKLWFLAKEAPFALFAPSKMILYTITSVQHPSALMGPKKFSEVAEELASFFRECWLHPRLIGGRYPGFKVNLDDSIWLSTETKPVFNLTPSDKVIV